jgi:NAD(P)H-dependent FMN reductase
MKILIFAGALRKDSLNKKFAREAQRLAGEIGGHEIELLDLKDYPMPVYDGDIEVESGLPDATKKLGEKISAADAIILSTPEYNGSIPGILKNVIDWLSRAKPVSLENKPLLLIAASPGALGGVRSLWQTRIPLEVVGVHVYPEMLGLPRAHEAFDENGRLKDEKMAERLKILIGKFLKHNDKG